VEWLIAAGATFAVIAPVELPDKTFVATLVLATRYRPLPVFVGVASAFVVHVALAVLAGSLLALLPRQPVQLAAAALFAAGAVILFRSARRADEAERDQEREYTRRATEAAATNGGWRAFAASFVLLFTAEWGDLSQLLIAGLVASGQPPTAVFVGALAATVGVAAAAILLGRWILRRVRLTVVRYLAAGVCAVLAVVLLVTSLV
jgi:Ca2+/H+ antiporter, TMEM165/GDT1 family